MEGDSYTPTAWLDGWDYRRAHMINGQAGAGTGYQIQIVVHYGEGPDNGTHVYLDSKCQIDFDDIRFTDDDETTVLPYWREAYIDSDYAQFWVKVSDSLDNDVIIFLYYGNSTVTSQSDATTVFEMYDGFNRASSGTVGNSWTEDQGIGAGIASVESNQLRIQQNADYYCHVEKSGPSNSNIVLQGRINPNVNTGHSWAPSIFLYWGTYQWFAIGPIDTDDDHYARRCEGTGVIGSHGGSIITGNWYYYRLQVSSTDISADYSYDGITWYSTMEASRPAGWSGSPSLIILGKGYSSNSAYPNADLDNNYATSGSIGNHYFDDVFVRKMTTVEPTSGTWGGEATPSGENWLEGWQLRKRHTMNGAAGAGTNYQVRLKVNFGEGVDSGENIYLNTAVDPNFADIRFTDTDYSLLFDYWIEEYVAYEYAIVWVEVPLDLSTNQDFYIYYGNMWATSASSGDETFLFFDDFSSGLDTSTKWVVYDTGYSITNDMLYMTASGNTIKIYSQPTFGPGISYNTRVYYRDVRSIGLVETDLSGEPNHGFGDLASFSTEPTARVDVEDEGIEEIDIVTLSESTWQTMSINWYSSAKLESFVDGSLLSTHTIRVPDGIPEIPIYYYTYSGDTVEYLIVDWNYVRKCIETEPTHGIWDNEEYRQSDTSPDEWLDGWDYRKLHKINGAPGTGTNYQVRITVHYGSGFDNGEHVYLDSKCQTNFQDVRFTASNGSTKLDYWVEYDLISNLAVFWVEVREDLSSDGLICIYYGNPDVFSESDGFATFPFFDDFNGVLNSTKWDVNGAAPSMTGGTARFYRGSGTTSTHSVILADNSLLDGNYRFITRMRWSQNRIYDDRYTIMGFGGSTFVNPTIAGVVIRDPSSSNYDLMIQETNTDSSFNLGGVVGTISTSYENYELLVPETGDYYASNGATTVSLLKTFDVTLRPTLGIEVRNLYASYYIYAYFDWVFVSNWNPQGEPTHGDWSGEQVQSLNNWGYYKSHVISGNGLDIDDYQVRIQVHYGSGTDSGENVYCNSHCIADFGDIRFTDFTKVRQLDYWIEDSISGDSATLWVKLGESTEFDQTIYMFYGNPAANTSSRGNDTMSRWAGYGSGDPVTPMSTWSYTGGSVSVQYDGVFIDTSGTSYSQYRIFTDMLSTTDRGIHVRFKPLDLGNNMYRFQPGMFVYRTTDLQASTYWAEGLVWSNTGIWLYYTSSSGVTADVAFLSASTPTVNHWYDVEMTISGTTCSISIVDENTSTTVLSTTQTVYNHDSTGLYGAFGQYSSTNPGNVDGWYNDIYVRKYRTPEPGHGVWGTESINVPPGTYPPIVITNNTQFSLHASSGDGSAGSPYILSGYGIRTAETCISISNTTAHFVIANTTLSSTVSHSSGIGILLHNVTNGKIADCIFISKATSIQIDNSSHNQVLGNDFSNTIYGIEIKDGSFNTTIKTNTMGVCQNSSIFLNEASYTNITTNSFEDGGILIYGEQSSNWYHSIESTEVNGKEILYIVNQANVQYNVSDYSQAIIASSDNVTVFDGYFLDVSVGVLFGLTNSSTAYHNFVGGTLSHGILDVNGIGNDLINNTVSNGQGSGIQLLGSNSVQAINNTVYGQDRYGILILDSETKTATGFKAWNNRLGYNTLGNAMDNGTSNLFDDDVSTGNAWHDYGGTGNYNVPGTAGSIDRYPAVLTNILPSVTGPSDFSVESEGTGSFITWDTESSLPDYYIITRDGILVDIGDWFGGQVSINVDGLDVDVYDYTLYVFDYVGFNDSDSVILTAIDTTAPRIESPPPFSYDFGSSGNSISWNLTDRYQSAYDIYRNGLHQLGGGVFGEVSIGIDGLGLGLHNYTIVAEDAYGNIGTGQVNVTVIDGTVPTIDTPADFIYETGMTGFNVTWMPSDLFPASYEVFRNTTEIQNGTWSGSTITAFASPLAIGAYNFTLYVYDVGNNNATDSIIVIVEAEANPIVDSPSDFWYEVDTSGHEITWNGSDRHPLNYQVLINSSPFESGPWVGDLVTVDVSAQYPGRIYNFTIILQDELGNNGIDTVWVRVRDLTSPILYPGTYLFYEYGRSNMIIDWNIIETYFDHYVLYHNGSEVGTGVSMVGSTFSFDTDTYLPGYHNFTLVVFDADMNNDSAAVFVTIYPTLPPTIDHPSDFTMELGSLHEIQWNPFDISPSSYSIEIDGTEVQSGLWTGGTILLQLQNESVGEHTIELIVFDFAGQSTTDVVIVTVVDTTVPILVEIDDNIWIQGTPIVAQEFAWDAYDLDPGTYILYRDGFIVREGTWNTTSPILFWFIPDANTAEVNFTLQISDGSGNTAYDSAWYIPHRLLDLNTPPDLEIYEDDFVDNLVWELERGNPVHYWLTVDYIEIEDGSWVGSEYTFDPNNLPVGVHYIALAIEDSLGYWFSDEVIVTVLETPTTTTTEPQLLVLTWIFIAIPVVVVAIIAVMFFMKKRVPA
jgi:hypothetical protein